MKAFLHNVALLLVASIIALVGIEIGVRVWGPDVLVLGNQNVFFKFDPVLGWANLPNIEGQFSRIEFSYPVKINSVGMRDAEITDKRKDEFRVAMLGDSFTWGVGVAYGERFTEVVEALNPKINVLNFGVSGYAPIQYLLQIDQVLALKPDYVIVALCLGNDLIDNVDSDPYGHPKPVAELSPDGTKVEIVGYPLAETSEVGPKLFGAGSSIRLVGFINQQLEHIRRKEAQEESTEGPPQYPVLDFIKKRFARLLRSSADIEAEAEKFRTSRSLYLASENLNPEQRRKVASMYKVNELLLDGIRKKVEAAIGPNRFAVLLAPTKYEYGMEQLLPAMGNPAAVAERVRGGLARLGIPSIDGRSVITPDDFWNVDGHWRPQGQRKVGELLSKFLATVMAEGGAAPDRDTGQPVRTGSSQR
jgi:hypothetical protein